MLWSSGSCGSKQMPAITAFVEHELRRAATRARKLVWALKRHLRTARACSLAAGQQILQDILLNAAWLPWGVSSAEGSALCLLPAHPGLMEEQGCDSQPSTKCSVPLDPSHTQQSSAISLKFTLFCHSLSCLGLVVKSGALSCGAFATC